MAGVEQKHREIVSGYKLPFIDKSVGETPVYTEQAEISTEAVYEACSPNAKGLFEEMEMATMQDGFDLNGNTH